eukprot:scaffold1112_cov92-Amphora_coffeaeformis.AAC.32
MQSTKYANVFGLGDCTSTPNSKTAAAITSQAPVVVHNVERLMAGKELDGSCDDDGAKAPDQRVEPYYEGSAHTILIPNLNSSGSPSDGKVAAVKWSVELLLVMLNTRGLFPRVSLTYDERNP